MIHSLGLRDDPTRRAVITPLSAEETEAQEGLTTCGKAQSLNGEAGI